MRKGSILVIADDLTGAAELGGIAVRYGLSTHIMEKPDLDSTAQVQVIHTNTRSLKIDEAMAKLGAIFSSTDMQSWAWIYLKFDSALRGHINQEISFYRSLFGGKRLFFCPVNPNLGRIIQGDEYLIHDQPIAETAFAHDPEFPVRTSKLLDILGSKEWFLVKGAKALPEEVKPIIPAVSSWEELDEWAKDIPSADLCAGAAAFFEALLRRRVDVVPTVEKAAVRLQKPTLYICGSNHPQSVARVSGVAPHSRVYWQRSGSEWSTAGQLLEVLLAQGVAVFAVAEEVAARAKEIRESMAKVLSLLSEELTIAELIIEGGATAYAVLHALGIHALQPVMEYGPGVIRCQVIDRELMVTLKPGSYPWTDALWAF